MLRAVPPALLNPKNAYPIARGSAAAANATAMLEGEGIYRDHEHELTIQRPLELDNISDRNILHRIVLSAAV